MCGICGIADFSGGSIDKQVIHAMTQQLKHRGPDDSGVEMLGAVALGHTRLSIIDLSAAGHQPMQSDDARVTLVFNGEIYNYLELRQVLENEGVAFGSHSDTEVVLKSYLNWGSEAFRKFNGMFALAIWDARSEQLHLARDRFGIKPLYYFMLPKGIVFGSEIKALLASKQLAQKLNHAGLHEYLYYGNALGSNTLFSGVAKLLPGHHLIISKIAAPLLEPFWQAELVKQVDDDSGHAADTVRSLLERAVKRQLVSDVPVGVFLSGGIDSSCITAFASKHYHGKLQTFSVGFDFDRGVNELPKAKQVANRFGAEHHELYIGGYDLPAVIERLVYSHDEPFGDAADIPLYLLCEKLAGSPKVILQGDGGDEIFAGYRRYALLSVHQLWMMLGQVGYRLVSTIHRMPYRQRLIRIFGAVKNTDSAMRMALLLTQESMDNPPIRILHLDLRQTVGQYDPFLRYAEFNRRFRNLDVVQRMLYTDTGIILPDTFLEKVDKATMSHGIEVRVPLLDNELADYVMGLPSTLKIRWGKRKWILRRALRGILPETILDAPKTGFGVPFSYWLRTSLAGFMQTVLLDPVILDGKLFDSVALETCIKEHVSGARDHGSLLWKSLNLALWYTRYAIDIH